MENTVDTKILAATRRNKIHPLKLALWVAIASLVMMFTALTSAYIVRQSAGNWLEFNIPNIFYLNTLVIVVSSLTLHGSYLAFKRQAKVAYQGLMVVTFLLGITFLVLQYLGWHELSAIGVPLKTNPSGDFVYAISGLHGLHILGGLGILLVSLLVAFLRPLKVTPIRKLRFELVLTYWHFVDLLWLYLIIFMSLYR
ncbi:cytochrome oxidase subunit III [Lewinellaceae bacterium SD302]|nr:cytochrome oxidase subunit III [Lewinellaceae bacterium SD302]